MIRSFGVGLIHDVIDIGRQRDKKIADLSLQVTEGCNQGHINALEERENRT